VTDGAEEKMAGQGSAPQPLPALGGNGEWTNGWRLLLAGTVANMIAMLPFYSLGTLITPISNDTGWSRTAITSAASIVALGTALITPFVGRIIDRKGPRAVGLAGLVISAAALATVSLAASPAMWLVMWVVVAAVMPFSGALVWVTGVTRQFNRNRGFALGIVLSGVTVMITLAPITAEWIVTHFGWRAAFLVIGGAGIAIALPIVALLFHPKSRPSPVAEAATDTRIEDAGLTFREATRTRTYWQLMAACFLGGAAASIIVIHLQPALIDGGLTAAAAAGLASFMGPAALVGRLGSGWLADRLHAPFIAAVILALPALSFAILLADPQSTAMIALAVILGGVAVGGEIDLFAFMSSRCFGQRSFATIHGTVISLHGLGFSAMSLAGGKIFDANGSYDNVLLPGAAACLVAAACMATISRARLAYRH
jgi:predicted MFS family arabinose efflux permease